MFIIWVGCSRPWSASYHINNHSQIILIFFSKIDFMFFFSEKKLCFWLFLYVRSSRICIKLKVSEDKELILIEKEANCQIFYYVLIFFICINLHNFTLLSFCIKYMRIMHSENYS